MGAGAAVWRTWRGEKPKAEKDGLVRCPRPGCGQRWPYLHPIFDGDGAAEWACEACVFDDVHAGKVSLRRKAVR